ncbi:MAG: alpha/beta fold hydrolase [Steroidobacteraceae bacterium]
MLAARISLLCLPCAGGSAGMFMRWQRYVPHWLRIVPLELPGHGARMGEAFIEDFDALVSALCTEHEHCTEGRYAFFGHSMGALVAYGMTMRWRRQGLSLPACLIASASPAPAYRDPDYFAGKESDESLIAELRKQDGTPEEVFESAEMLAITLAALRADYRTCASYRYRPSPSLPVPIHVLAGRADSIGTDRLLAWEAETSARFSVRWFDGGHFFIRQHESLVLSAAIQAMRSDERTQLFDAPAVGA